MAQAQAHVPVVPPWYRQLWPWLLMLAPAAALFGGIFTWWLAAHSNNSLVVDDYYREGRAINQQLARDHQASRLELSASVSAAGAGVRVELHSVPLAGSGWPETLVLRLVHATDAALDGELRLAHLGIGHYLGSGALPARGHWIVQIEDLARDWRLITRAERFDAPLMLRADASPGKDRAGADKSGGDVR